MDWKKNLAQYLTGEVKKYDADTFYLEHKDFSRNTGYNMLGQYMGGDDYKYYVWVGIQTPEGVDTLETANTVANIITSHSDFFPGVKMKQAYSEGISRYGVILVMNDAPDAFVEKIKNIAMLNENPGGGSDNTIKYIVIGFAAVVVTLLLVYFMKGGKK